MHVAGCLQPVGKLDEMVIAEWHIKLPGLIFTDSKKFRLKNRQNRASKPQYEQLCRKGNEKVSLGLKEGLTIPFIRRNYGDHGYTPNNIPRRHSVP
jgi:hypothetical protein